MPYFKCLLLNKINNAKYKNDPNPIDPKCSCPTCKKHSAAYLHHLFKSKEMLGGMLLTQHNIHFYQNLMRGIRDAIEKRKLKNFADEFIKNYSQK